MAERNAAVEHAGREKQDICRRVATVAFRLGLDGASRTGRREFRRARLPQLEGWPTGERPRASPTAEASTGPSACAGGRPGGWSMGESTDTESTVAAAERRGHMRENASHRGRGAHLRRVEPRGVVGDEGESAETDLSTLNQNSSSHHDVSTRKNRNFSTKLLKHLPHGGRQLSWERFRQ